MTTTSDSSPGNRAEPVFETGLLLAGDVNPADVRRQLSRWVSAGRLYRLRRGLYALAPPFAKIESPPFLVANRLLEGSYVSLQSALAYHGLIPETALLTTSVTTQRPTQWDTPLGGYTFRHLKREMLFGYQLTEVGVGQRAFVATPEKALLDLVYFQPHGDAPEYLKELRLQGFESLDLERLQSQTEMTKSTKLRRAADVVLELATIEAQEYEPA